MHMAFRKKLWQRLVNSGNKFQFQVVYTFLVVCVGFVRALCMGNCGLEYAGERRRDEKGETETHKQEIYPVMWCINKFSADSSTFIKITKTQKAMILQKGRNLVLRILTCSDYGSLFKTGVKAAPGNHYFTYILPWGVREGVGGLEEDGSWSVEEIGDRYKIITIS